MNTNIRFVTILIFALTISVKAVHGPLEKPFVVNSDAYISKRHRTQNFGSSEILLVGKTENGEKLNTILDFSQSTVVPPRNFSKDVKTDPHFTQGIATYDILGKVTVTLYAESVTSSTDSVTLAVYPTDSFDETISTWRNSGKIIGKVSDTVVLNSGTTGAVSFDVTSSVNDGHRAFIIISKGSENTGNEHLVRFSSKESGKGAVLTVFKAAADIIPPETGCVDKVMPLLDTSGNTVNIAWTDCPYTGGNDGYYLCSNLHGAHSNKKLFRNLHPHVQGVCRSIAMDLPGAGDSEDVFTDRVTKVRFTESAEIYKKFISAVVASDSKIIAVAQNGNDFGGAIMRRSELDLIDEINFEYVFDISSVMLNHVMCAPENEGITCSSYGALGGVNSPIYRILHENEVVPGCEPSGDIILRTPGAWGFDSLKFYDNRVKFWNNSNPYDPRNYEYPWIAGTCMPTSPVLIALPFPGSSCVIDLLTQDRQTDELLDNVYYRSQFVSGTRPYGQKYIEEFPETLCAAGVPSSPRSAPYCKTLVDTVEAYKPGGKLSHLIKSYPYFEADIVASPSQSDVEYSESTYPNFTSGLIGRSIQHYYCEDDIGCESTGIHITRTLS